MASIRIAITAGQARSVGEHPSDDAAGVEDDVVAADFDAQAAGPIGTLHARSAPVLWIVESSRNPIILELTHFSRTRHHKSCQPT